GSGWLLDAAGPSQEARAAGGCPDDADDEDVGDPDATRHSGCPLVARVDCRVVAVECIAGAVLSRTGGTMAGDRSVDDVARCVGPERVRELQLHEQEEEAHGAHHMTLGAAQPLALSPTGEAC